MRRFLGLIKRDFFAVIFAVSLIACGVVLVVMTERATRDANLVTGNWEKYSAARSEKIQVVTAMRQEMGYGGMIHKFKNYILRGELLDLTAAREKFGGIETALARYRALGTDSREEAAIAVLADTVQAYRDASILAFELMQLGVPVKELDRRVRVDDQPALEALSVLAEKTSGSMIASSKISTKADSVNALRAAIGYGGMIHEFKNYVLRGGVHRALAVAQKITDAERAIEAFSRRPLRQAEKQALDDIRDMLQKYAGAVGVVTKLLAQEYEPDVIDRAVKIDDTPALTAFTTLEREHNIEIEAGAAEVAGALREVNELVWSSFWIMLALIVTMIMWASWVQVDRRRSQQELKLGEERFRATFETSAVGSALIALDGEYLQANDAFCQIIGYGEQEIIGRNWRDLIHSDDVAAAEAEEAEIYAGEKDHSITEKRYVAKNGDVVWTNLGATLIHRLDGSPEVILAQIVDITEQKRNEHDLIETQEKLQSSILEVIDARERIEKQVAAQIQMSEDLVEARDEAEAANKAKSEFLAAMSHEIRTPMTGVMGFADMLLEESLAPGSREKVFKIKDSTRSLMRIINDILDISKMEAGKLELEFIDFHLPSLITDVLDLFQEKRKGDRENNILLAAELDDDFPVGINSDPTRLRQIFINLVGNAIKFTEEGHVTIRGETRDSRDGQKFLYFAIQDTGIGIKKDVVAKLFSEFTQADASITRRFEGSGLGLSICKRLIELLGGEIGVESVYGEGSTFWFTLPYVPAKSEVSEQPSLAGPIVANYQARRSLNVLIAEDNALNQQIVLATITGFGHTVNIVENGALAVEAHKTHQYDLILMDVRMPEMSGPDATRVIRKMTGAKRDIPIIALTADAMEEHKKGYLEAGMNDVVTKPIDRTELAQSINAVIGEEIHTPISVYTCSPCAPSDEPDQEDTQTAVDSFLKSIGATTSGGSN